jgi:hypothetical protein
VSLSKNVVLSLSKDGGATNAEVLIQPQERQSLALKVTPGGVVALIPRDLDPESARVRAFIEAGLRRLPDPAPVPPSERLTAEELRDAVAAWAARIGVAVTRVQVRSMRTKWASCSTRGTLTLSADLLTLPRDLVDYVICHDLVHLRVPDHGQGFQALMGCHMPDWRERQHRLARWVIADGED